MNEKRTIGIVILFLFMAYPIKLFAQKDTVNLYGYNLIELSKLKVNSVSKIPQAFENAPASIHIISKEEIRENGYFTLDDLVSNLQGFQFRNTLGYNSYIFQRGMPNQNNLTLVLIDGIRINELNSGGFYAGGHYNLENIELVEVVYGPASVIYGTNAVSGVINLITKEDTGLNASILVGNFNTLNTNLSYGYEQNDFKIRFSGMFKTSEKVDLRGDKGDNNWTEEMENYEDDYAFDTKIRFKKFSAGINYQNKRTSASTYYPSVGTVYQDHGTSWNVRFINTYIKHEQNFSDNFTLASRIYFRNSTVMDNSIFKIVDTAQFRYYRPNNLTGAESILNYSRNKMEIVGGIMFEAEHLAEGFSITNSNSPEEIPPTPEKPNMLNNNLFSFFLQSNYKIIPKLSLTGGLRYDKSSVYNQVLTPRVSLLYNHKHFNSKLLYGEAFRAPKPWDYTIGLGNNDLLPEQMQSLELSNNIYLSKSIVVNLALYRNNLNRAFVKEYYGYGDNYKWVNKGRFNTNGTEIAVRYSLNKMKLYANYTFNYTYDENKEAVPEIAKHTANAGVTYRFMNYFRINLRANYIGKRKNPQKITASNSHYIEPALIFHGALSLIDFHKFDLQLIVRNILDTEYYHTSNRLIERYRQPQRMVMLKVAYNL